MFAKSLVMQLALKAYPNSGYEELKLQTQTDANAFFSLPRLHRCLVVTSRIYRIDSYGSKD